MRTLRSIAEIGVGLLYAAGAVFNAVYTLRNTERFYGTWADGAWSNPARSFIRSVVIPNGRLFTIVLIAFQVAIAIAILTRGAAVQPALFAGGSFAVAVAFFSSPGGAVGNLVLAAIQYALALAR